MEVATLITTRKLAEYLGCSRTTINNLRKRGRIKGYRIVRTWRYDLREVREALGEILPEPGYDPSLLPGRE